MNTVFPAILELARRILAVEAARAKAADARVDEAVRVCEKLQAPLSRLTGPAGFSSLLSRALTLTKGEVPSLRVVQVQRDGSLAGYDQIKHDHDAGAFEKGRVVLVANLLGLLATFIGESLTLRLVLDAWPDVVIDDSDLKEKVKL